jgi:DNA-binding SARP family transcriptional activator
MAASPVSLASSKTAEPRLSAVLPRSRLFGAIDKARRCPLVWVTGPAGSGKTTLVSSYLKARRVPAVWYRIDPLDGDLGRLFHHLSNGLAGTRRRRRIELPHPSSTGDDAPDMVLRYFEAFFRAHNLGSALVFDDYHENPSSAVWELALREALRAVPKGSNIVVLSRGDPPRALIRSGLQHEVAVVDGAMLALTPEETQRLADPRFFRRRAKLPRNAIAKVHEAARGWLAGTMLYLESLHATGGYGVPDDLGTPERLFDYIASEIFERVEEATQELLLQTAILPTMTLALADELVGVRGAGRELLRPFGFHHFVEHQGGSSASDSIYRYHPLFRAFLLRRGQETKPAPLLQEWRRRAAALLVSNGRSDEAVELFHETSDWEEVARVVRREAPALVARGEVKTLGRWLGLIAPERVACDAWLLYWDGRARLGGDPKGAFAQFERAMRGFEAANDDAGCGLAWAAGTRAIVLDGSNLRALDPWLERLQQVPGAQAPDAPGPGSRPGTDAAHVEAQRVEAMILALTYRGRGKEANQWVERALELAPQMADPAARFGLVATLLLYCAMQSDLGRAASLLSMLDVMGHEHKGDPLVRLVACAAQAMISGATGDHRVCLERVRDGLSLARATGASHLSDRLLLYGTLAALNLGEDEQARGFVRELAGIAVRGTPFDLGSYHFAAYLVARAGGAAAEAAHSARAALAAARAIDIPRFRATSALLVAAVELETGRPEEARPYLAEVRGIEEASGMEVLRFYRLLFEADLAFREGHGEGVAVLRSCFGLGRTLGVYHCFWLSRRRLTDLCIHALAAEIEVDYTRTFVRRLGLWPDEPPVLVAGWPWPLQLFTLGHFEVRREGQPLTGTRRGQPMPIRLLKALVALGAFGGRSVAAEHVIDALWPDLEGDAAAHALEMTLSRLRRELGDPEIVELRQGRLALHSEKCWVDLWALQKVVDSRDGSVQEVLSLYRGPFLATDPPLPWIEAARERIRSRFAHHIARVGQDLERRSECAAAADVYRRALSVEEHAEPIYAGLIALYDRQGRAREAAEIKKRRERVLL